MKNDIEKTLEILFDYQKFEQEPTLRDVIDDVRMKSNIRALSDDDIELATAGIDLDVELPQHDIPYDNDHTIQMQNSPK